MAGKKTKTDFLVFGATGMQGKIVVRDLWNSGYQIAASSRSLPNLDALKNKFSSLQIRAVDLKNNNAVGQLIAATKPAVIINCAEGDWNLSVYQAALKNKTHVIDLGSDIPTTDKQIGLNENFKKRELTAITGCGSTPGINNVMLSYAINQFNQVDTIEAGFAWNSNIKTFVVPFSMESIIEEFTQPAPVIEAGNWNEKIPLDTVSKKRFLGVGLQKCFLVRHPETQTFFFYYKNTGLKNVRFYAGFPEYSFKKIKSYLTGKTPPKNKVVYVKGSNVPLGDLTNVLQAMYPPPPNYTEKENLWVRIKGKKDDRQYNLRMECIVPTLPDWRDAGCNIDTGFPASIIGQMILSGDIKQRGSFAPEAVVPHQEFFKKLREKSMTILMNGKEIA